MTIEEAVKASGAFAPFQKGSIKAAEKMLSPNEELLYATVANVSIVPVRGSLNVDPTKINNKLSGVLAVTSKRIFFCNKVLGMGTSKQIMLQDVTSIDDNTSLFKMTKLRICGITEMFVIDGSTKINDPIQRAINEARL